MLAFLGGLIMWIAIGGTLFAGVFFPAALNTHNAEFIVDLLDGPGVVFGQGFVAN